MLPGIGLAILFAATLQSWRGGLGRLRGWRRLIAGAAGGGLALGVLLCNPLSRTAHILMLRQMAEREQQLAQSPLTSCQKAEFLFLFGTDDIAVALHSPYLLKQHLLHKQWYQITLATADTQVLRVDPRTVRIQSPRGLVLGGVLYAMMRTEAIQAGTRFDVGTGTVQVEQASASGVTAFRLELPPSVDDPRFCWLRYDGTQLVPMSLPPVGGSTTVPYVRGPMSM
jgi:hypothetical protein